MINPQYVLDLYDELIVDNFAGGGGASTGIELGLGRFPDHAINHDGAALGMHRINHPQTIHHCEDVWDINPEDITRIRRQARNQRKKHRRVGFGWFSPDCKHFSKAKGGKPVEKKIRGLALVMLRWAKIRTRVMTMENVEEIQTWGPLLPDNKPDPKHRGRTWRAFLDALGPGLPPDHPDLPDMLELLRGSVTKAELVSGFGYTTESRELRACDFGAPTIRKRLFMIARCDGQPIVWPKPTHAAPTEAKRLGLKPWRMIAECIEWHLPCPSIFLTKAQARQARCKRPLARATLRRVATGIGRYVIHAKEPFLVNLTHQGGDRIESVSEPARTITGAHRGEKAVVDATLAPFVTEHANATHQRSFPADEPMRTQCANVKGGHFALVAGQIVGCGGRAAQSRPRNVSEPLATATAKADSCLVAAHLTKFTTGAVGSTAAAPLPTITAGSHSPETHGGAASTHGLVAANMVKMRGAPETHAPGHPANEPGHTSSAGGQHHALSACYLARDFGQSIGQQAAAPGPTIMPGGQGKTKVVSANLAAYYGSEQDGQAVDEPLRTQSTKARFGLAMSEAIAPVMTPDQIAGAHRVAAFLREYGVEFEGEFAMVGEFVIVDIGMRMLTPRELFRAQGFPETHVIDRAWLIDPATGDLREVKLTKEQQIRMCGNSVCPPVAAAIAAANVPELMVWRKGEYHRIRRLSQLQPA